MRKKIGDKGQKDIIKFESDNSAAIEVFAEDISDVSTERRSTELHGNDLVLRINCNFRHSDGTTKDIKVLFNLNDVIIANVLKG